MQKPRACSVDGPPALFEGGEGVSAPLNNVQRCNAPDSPIKKGCAVAAITGPTTLLADITREGLYK